MKATLHILKSVFFLCSFFYILNVQAQAPNRMSYQAVVRNTANALIANSNVGIQISILQTTATGTPVFVERHTTTTNINGLATIEIGGGTVVSGSFATVDWANGPYFIKTETDPIGGTNYTISGTSQLLSVPYALFAKESGSGWSLQGNTLGNTSPFLGTLDDRDLFFRRNNTGAGMITLTSTALGSEALLSGVNTTFNTAIGLRAMKSNNGGSNTAVGADALSASSNGAFNVALGRGALIGNCFFCNNNTAVGTFSLSSNSGEDNVAVGFRAMNANNSGDNITALGSNALFTNTTGDNNTAVGQSSLKANTAGSNNTAAGKDALLANTTGINNAAVGFSALLANTTGASNVALGVQALDSNTTGNDNTAIGRSTLNDNVIGVSNTAIGKDALFNSLGNNNTALGRGTLSGVTTGNNNTAIGFDAQVSNGANSNQVRLGNTAVTLVSAQVALTVTSDQRWKSNIQKSNLGLDFIKQLNPVFYTRKDVAVNAGKSVISENTSNPTTEYGFIAQELETTLKKFDTTNNGIITKDDGGMYGIRYNDLIAPIVKAMQEQQAIIDAQAKKIEEISKQLESFLNKR